MTADESREVSADAGHGEETSEQSAEPQSTSAASEAARPSFFSWLKQLFGLKDASSLQENIAGALSDAAQGKSSASASEVAMLHNILRLREARVEDVMIPRADVEAVELSTSLGELLDYFEKSGHSRMPVYSETLDDPRGMIHIRDVVAYLTRASRQKKTRKGTAKGAAAKPAPREAKINLASVDLARPVGELNLTRPVLYVPPSMHASELMARMQANRIQMALVIDEYGGTDGLVSLEDIVEMVVGDIEDEHDDEEALITQAGEGVFIVDAKAEIEDVAEMIGGSFNAGEHSDDVDTIGGMIFNSLGRIPARGEVVQAVPGYEFHVLEADPRRIKRVRIVPVRVADRRRRTNRPQGA